MARPAFRLVEDVSDGVLRFHAFLSCSPAILPDDLNRGLVPRAPGNDSYDSFARTFQKKEFRYLERLTEAYPTRQDVAVGSYSPAQLDAWSSWARAEQVSVAVDFPAGHLSGPISAPSFFGRQSAGYAKDTRNWDPGFLAIVGARRRGFRLSQRNPYQRCSGTASSSAWTCAPG